MIPLNKMNGVDWTNEDLSKKWSRTFVLCSVPSPGNPRKEGIAYISEAGIDNGKVLYSFTSKHNDEKICKGDEFLVIEDRPPVCITNRAKSAFLFTYNPERQWKRGICRDNSFIFKAPNLELQYGLDFEDLDKIFKPDHTHLDSALNAFRKDSELSARALNNRYWLVRRQGDDVIKLYRRFAFMGSFIGKKFFINSGARIFRAELNMELPILKEKYAYA